MARRDGGTGSMQISMAFRNDLRDTPTPEACIALAQKFADRPGMGEPFASVQVAEIGSLFGGFSFTVGDEFNRVWYRLVNGQLALGLYGCSKEKLQGTELNECEAMMKSAEYEQPAG